MKAYFLQMFAYNEWASNLLIETIEQNAVEDAQVHTWMSHISNAEYIWWDRMHNRQPRVAVWEAHSLEKIKSQISQFHQEMNAWLAEVSQEELKKIFKYSNSRGKEFSNTFEEILAHLVNHGTHHRAQISSRIRALGIAPPATDYIFYARA